MIDHRRWDRVPPYARNHPELVRAASSTALFDAIARLVLGVGCIVLAATILYVTCGGTP